MKAFMQFNYFRNHTKIMLVELDEVYRHFQRIKKADPRFELTFGEFVDNWRDAEFEIL